MACSQMASRADAFPPNKAMAPADAPSFRRKIRHRELVQRIQSRVEGPVFVLEIVQVRRVVEQREFRPRMARQVVDLLLVQIESLQDAGIREHLLGVRFARDVPHHVVAPWIRNHGELELVEVAPEHVITGAVEMFRAGVSVETVCKTVAKSEDVPARSSGSFEHSDLVPTPREFVSAAESANARACDDDFLRPSGLRSRRGHGNSGGRDSGHQLLQKIPARDRLHRGEA